MTAANDPIDLRVEASGADVAAAQYAALSKSVGTADAAHQAFNASAKASNDNNAKLKQSGAAAAQAMNALSVGVSKVAPELAGLQSAIGVVNGSMQGMLTLIGGGPGVLLGGLVAATALLSKAWSDQKRTIEELDAAIDASVEKMKKHAETSVDYAVRIDQERVLLAAQLRAENAASIDTYEGRQAASAANAAALAEMEAAVSSGATRRKRGGGKSRGGFNDTINTLAGSGGGIDDVGLQNAFAPDDETEKLMALDSARQSSLDAFISGKAAESAVMRDSIAEKEAMFAREAELEKMRIGIIGATAGAMTGELAKVAKGQKASAGAMIESIGDFMVADGTRAMLQGAVMSANPLTPGIGGPLIAAGAIELAAGLGLGAVGARNGGSSTQQSASGGGGAPQQARATSPYASTSGALSSGGNTVIVNMPTVVSPGPEDGRRVQQAAEQAQRVYGRNAA